MPLETASNTLWGITLPMATFGCNTAVFACNTSVWSSNTATWGCNVAVTTSNFTYAAAAAQAQTILTQRVTLCNAGSAGALTLALVATSSGGGLGTVQATREGALAAESASALTLRAADAGAGQAWAAWAGWAASNMCAPLAYPPAALGADAATTLLNVPYGAGEYVVGASSSNATAWQPFSRSNVSGNAAGLAWSSEPGYTSVTGYAFQPASGATRAVPATTVDGTTYQGDWLQVRVPEPVVPAGYTLTPAINAVDGQPRRFVLAASADGGATWTGIDATYATADVAPTNSTVSITVPALSAAANAAASSGGVGGFTLFRLIVLRVAVSASPPTSLLPVTVCALQLSAAPAVAGLGLTRRGLLVTGQLGVGTAAPSQRLDVRGSATVSSNVGIGVAAPTAALHLSRDSTLKPSTSTWGTFSDARLKEDIKEADLGRCYDIVRSVPLRRFAWRAEVAAESGIEDRHKLGWIAQEVEPYFKKAVTTQSLHGLPDCRALNADQLYAVLWGAVQRLQATVEDLQAQLLAR